MDKRADLPLGDMNRVVALNSDGGINMCVYYDIRFASAMRRPNNYFLALIPALILNLAKRYRFLLIRSRPQLPQNLSEFLQNLEQEVEGTGGFNDLSIR